MIITDVRVKKINGDKGGRLKAYVDLTFDESFVIHGLKLIDGENGMFIAMPSRKMPDGEFKDIVHPTNPELRKLITDTVIAKYEEILLAEPQEEEVKVVVEED